MKWKIGFSCIFVLSMTMLPRSIGAAAEKRQHGAHAHGVAEINIAIDGGKADVEFRAPAENVMGFEHEAKSEIDKKKRDAALRTVRTKMQQMVVFDLKLGCKLWEINSFAEEPLSAVIPGVALSELWSGIGFGEQVLKVVALFVVIVGLVGMLMALYTSLNERRREIAILRAVGMGPLKIMCLLVAESGLLSLAGSLLGIGLVYSLVISLQPLVEQQFGLYLPIKLLSTTEHLYVVAVVLAGLVIGFIPAWKAYRNALSDGLSVRI